MLHKSKSKKINQLKYVLVIPILGIFLMSFNTKNVYIEKEIPISENSFISNSFIKDALITNDDIINKKEVIKNKSTTKSSIKKPAVINTKTYKKIVKTTGIIDIVLITKKFTDADFKKITNNLKKKGVTIKFKGIKRNKDNEITAIKIDISSKNSSANYSISSDEAIKPIKISFNEDDESISIGNGSARHVHGDNVYTFKTKGKKHKIHKSGKGTNTFVFSHDDDDHKIHIVNEDTIIHTSHGKKGKHRMIKKSKHVKIISDDSDENIEVIIESYNGKEPLYILNGKEIKKEKFENIEGNDIKNVSVLKGDDAIKKYGNKAKDGVIEITTKKKN